MARVAASLGVTFKDLDNILLPDVTLEEVVAVFVDVRDVELSVWSDEGVLSLKLLDGLVYHFDNLASDKWLSKGKLLIPMVSVQGLAAFESGTEKKQNRWFEVLSVQTSLTLRIFTKDPDPYTQKRRQRDFLSIHDRKTGRCRYILEDRHLDLASDDQDAFNPPFPLMEDESQSPLKSFLDLAMEGRSPQTVRYLIFLGGFPVSDTSKAI